MSKIKMFTIGTIITLAIGGAAYAYIATSSSDTQSRTSPTTSPDQKADETKQPEPDITPSEDPDDDTNQPPSKTPVQYSPADDSKDSGAKSGTLTGVITSKSVSNKTLRIRTTINDKLSDGSCKLTLTRSSDNKKFTQSSGLVQNPSSSSCEGFDIATSQLGSGTWRILISVTSGDRSGNIKGDVTL